jgi:hypothetical protein
MLILKPRTVILVKILDFYPVTQSLYGLKTPEVVVGLGGVAEVKKTTDSS